MRWVEVLAVGSPDDPGALDPWPTRQRSGPRVVVLEAAPDDLPAIARAAGFAMRRGADGGITTAGDPDALESLDEGARLFVDAWRLRSDPGRTDTSRPGDGLPWDAPGFDAP